MDTAKRGAIAAALTRTGHVDALAEALDVTPRQVARWLDGMDLPPDDICTSALQIVANDSRRSH